MTPNPTRYCAALLLTLSISLPAAAQDGGPGAPNGSPAATPAQPAKPQAGAPAKPATPAAPANPKAVTATSADHGHHGKPGSSAAAADGPAPKDSAEGADDGASEDAAPKLKGNPNAHLSKEGMKARREAMRRFREAERMLTAAQRAEASDDPKAAEKKEKALKASEKARKLAAAALDEMRAERIRGGDKLDPAKKKEIEERVAAADAERGKTREERAKKSRAELDKAYGKKVEDPTLRAELNRHAWRVARIEQLIAMAEASGKTDLAERARTLLTREGEKHQRRLDDIASGDFVKPTALSGSAAVARPDGSAPSSVPAAKMAPGKPEQSKPVKPTVAKPAPATEGGAQ